MRIKAIYVYPIKSIRGCSPPSLIATPTGFSYDRRFVLIRPSDGKPLSLAKSHELCLFKTELYPEDKPEKVRVRYLKDYAFNKPEERVEDELLDVPLTPDHEAEKLTERELEMHGSPTITYEMGDHFDSWFSKRLGFEVKLLYIGENRRKVLGNLSPNHQEPIANNNQAPSQSWLNPIGSLLSTITNYATATEPIDDDEYRGIDEGLGFSDVAPFLLVTTKSWEDVSARVPDEPYDIVKFRPNIVVENTGPAFEEDYWAELAIGDDGVGISLTSNCARCATLNIDYDTGKAGQGPAGRMLKSLQADRRVDKGMKYSPVFGRYGFLARKGKQEEAEVTVRVGDEVKVVKRNEERTRFQWPGVSTDK